MTRIGKQVGARLYVGAHQVDTLTEEAKGLVAKGEALLPRALGDVNVLRVDPTRSEVAFLSYPDLGRSPFPALKSSWRVDVSAGLVNNRRYDTSLNPPILHRTELLLAADHPVRAQCEALTKDCEALGLFNDPTRIGFQQQWEYLIRSSGYRIQGFNLVPIGNVDCENVTDALDIQIGKTKVARHLTALTRNALSAPVQRLMSDCLLTAGRSFFDYGCGRGDDLAALETNGFAVAGWDPHFRPEGSRIEADVVNIGFVINVIEDNEERREALRGAYDLTRGVLSVAAMLGNNDVSKGSEYRDGVLTSRNTFQKYFSQLELRHYIESVLGEEAYPAAPGVFYVFRNRELEQRYLVSRTANRSRVRQALVRYPKRDATVTTTIAFHERIQRRRAAPADKPVSEEVRQALERLWVTALELGRPPEPDEVEGTADLIQHFRSLKRAWSACVASNDMQILEMSARGRREDILVMLALRTFDRRRKFEKLEPRLWRDVKASFGSIRAAESEATKLLLSLQDTDVIDAACQEAAVIGLGWLERGKSLQLHTSQITRLPAALRVYVGCASVMAGDLTGYDVVKVHIRSGKVSLMAYDDFEGKPVPLLLRRVKVRLRDQELDIFEYGEEHPPTTLFHKSRYINEEFPRYAEQIQVEELLESIGVFDPSMYGPDERTFNEQLARRRYAVSGFSLVRSTDIPDLDAHCGTNFRYRDLIECGETWHGSRVDNVPDAAASYNSLCDLCISILDPVIEYFGAVELTYCFASANLTKHIPGRIAPELDQHAACEKARSGRPICSRGGAAVDFLVRDEDMHEVARWIAEHCSFDRIYLYGKDRPLHVSVGPEETRAVYYLEERDGKRFPRAIDVSTL